MLVISSTNLFRQQTLQLLFLHWSQHQHDTNHMYPESTIVHMSDDRESVKLSVLLLILILILMCPYPLYILNLFYIDIGSYWMKYVCYVTDQYSGMCLDA